MTDVKQLIEKQRLINNPPPVVEREPKPVPRNGRLDELIAKAKAHHANPVFEDMEVVLAGEIVKLSIAHAWPDDWSELEDMHPPKTPEDRNTGYNRRTLPRDYPTDRIKADNAPLDAETWRSLYDVLDADQQDSVSALMWGLNVLEPAQRHQRAMATANE